VFFIVAWLSYCAAAPCDFFCVDFEKDLPASFSLGADAKVVTNKGHASNSSLHFYSEGGGAYDTGFMTYNNILAAEHYGRVFYNLEVSDPAGNAYMHASFVVSDTSPQIRVVDTVRMSNGQEQYLYNWADDQKGKSSAYDYKVQIDKWVCAEWHIDTTRRTFEFWVDGTLVPDISGTVERAIPAQYPNLRFGGQVYQTNAGLPPPPSPPLTSFTLLHSHHHPPATTTYHHLSTTTHNLTHHLTHHLIITPPPSGVRLDRRYRC
jgi:hypothetical protein